MCIHIQSITFAHYCIIVAFILFTGKSVPGFAQPTVSYNMHVSTQPQDDGYTLVPDPVTAQSLLEESEGTFTLSSSQETFSIRSDSSQVNLFLWPFLHSTCLQVSQYI